MQGVPENVLPASKILIYNNFNPESAKSISPAKNIMCMYLIFVQFLSLKVEMVEPEHTYCENNKNEPIKKFQGK